MDWSKYKVYVHGPGAFLYMQMFHRAGFEGVKSPDEADIICFTGGEDVHPSFYNEENAKDSRGRSLSYTNMKRDEVDARMYGYCLASGKFMVGICRGGQFLNVMNGGSMWQHVDGHAGGPHNLVDTITGQVVRVTSTHHQMMRPADDGIVIATARESSHKIGAVREWHIEHDMQAQPDDLDDIEVVWYGEAKCLCFQPHPEFGAQETAEYFFSVLADCIASPVQVTTVRKQNASSRKKKA